MRIVNLMLAGSVLLAVPFHSAWAKPTWVPPKAAIFKEIKAEFGAIKAEKAAIAHVEAELTSVINSYRFCGGPLSNGCVYNLNRLQIGLDKQLAADEAALKADIKDLHQDFSQLR